MLININISKYNNELSKYIIYYYLVHIGGIQDWKGCPDGTTHYEINIETKKITLLSLKKSHNKDIEFEDFRKIYDILCYFIK